MDCHIHAHLLLNALILIIRASPSVSSSHILSTEKHNKSGFRVNMIHRDSLDATVNNMTFGERVARAVERSTSREHQIQNVISTKAARATLQLGYGNYVVKLAVGTPPVLINALVDTGTDLLWVDCQLCARCFEGSTPAYLAFRSSTFSKVPCEDRLCRSLEVKICNPDCNYTYAYGDGSLSNGILSYDTWTIGGEFSDGVQFHPVAFGCSIDKRGFFEVHGIVGLGRGPLSLISQIGPHIENKFSYCLLPSDDPTKTSTLYFGQSADLGPAARTVPYYVHPEAEQTFYYLPLEGISVANSLLSIPRGTFEVYPGGTGGVILDSGTPLTILEDAAYQAVAVAVQSIMQMPLVQGDGFGLDLCFDASSAAEGFIMPNLTLHFQGGTRWDIPGYNVFLVSDAEDTILCLAMKAKSGYAGIAPSILGSILQQNFRVLFDNVHDTLSFLPAQCDIV